MQNLARAIAAFARARNELLDVIERQVAEINVHGRRLGQGLAIGVHGPVILIETPP
jgi:hypothetical protein